MKIWAKHQDKVDIFCIILLFYMRQCSGNCEYILSIFIPHLLSSLPFHVLSLVPFVSPDSFSSTSIPSVQTIL